MHRKKQCGIFFLSTFYMIFFFFSTIFFSISNCNLIEFSLFDVARADKGARAHEIVCEQCDDDCDDPEDEIGPLPAVLGLLALDRIDVAAAKVHAVDLGQQARGRKDDRDHREHIHDKVEAVLLLTHHGRRDRALPLLHRVEKRALRRHNRRVRLKTEQQRIVLVAVRDGQHLFHFGQHRQRRRKPAVDLVNVALDHRELLDPFERQRIVRKVDMIVDQLQLLLNVADGLPHQRDNRVEHRIDEVARIVEAHLCAHRNDLAQQIRRHARELAADGQNHALVNQENRQRRDGNLLRTRGLVVGLEPSAAHLIQQNMNAPPVDVHLGDLGVVETVLNLKRGQIVRVREPQHHTGILARKVNPPNRALRRIGRLLQKVHDLDRVVPAFHGQHAAVGIVDIIVDTERLAQLALGRRAACCKLLDKLHKLGLGQILALIRVELADQRAQTRLCKVELRPPQTRKPVVELLVRQTARVVHIELVKHLLEMVAAHIKLGIKLENPNVLGLFFVLKVLAVLLRGPYRARPAREPARGPVRIVVLIRVTVFGERLRRPPRPGRARRARRCRARARVLLVENRRLLPLQNLIQKIGFSLAAKHWRREQLGLDPVVANSMHEIAPAVARHHQRRAGRQPSRHKRCALRVHVGHRLRNGPAWAREQVQRTRLVCGLGALDVLAVGTLPLLGALGRIARGNHRAALGNQRRPRRKRRRRTRGRRTRELGLRRTARLRCRACGRRGRVLGIREKVQRQLIVGNRRGLLGIAAVQLRVELLNDLVHLVVVVL
eukprot:comp15083_c0_seq1/m.22481 comp15083_c0_seq1/g.22481  ORF comp15083_c0_seq1/g.22481 comp15083_c0_seq1/m.22481 type:complete len:777 (+) comp15083_c0_seq1:108-2438(+)